MRGPTTTRTKGEVLNGDAIAGHDGWNAMARQGSAMLLDAMLAYYAKHHPTSVKLSTKQSMENAGVNSMKNLTSEL